MANNDDRSMVGALVLALVLLAVLVSVAVSMAIGYGLGREWGWLAWAAFLIVYCVIIGTTIRRIAKEGRDDG